MPLVMIAAGLIIAGNFAVIWAIDPDPCTDNHNERLMGAGVVLMAIGSIIALVVSAGQKNATQ